MEYARLLVILQVEFSGARLDAMVDWSQTQYRSQDNQLQVQQASDCIDGQIKQMMDRSKSRTDLESFQDLVCVRPIVHLAGDSAL